MTALFVLSVNVLLLVLITLYVWPRPEQRFEKFLVAICGAFIGSLVGRLLFDPAQIGHLGFVTGGAILFSLVDWARRSAPSPRSKS